MKHEPILRGRPRLILASASTARAELLVASGIAFEQRPPHLPEPHPHRGERLGAYVARLARLKAESAVGHVDPNDWILAADTAICFRGRILGKPGTILRARRMLAELQGQSHLLTTAVCLLGPETARGTRRRLEGRDTVRVILRRLTTAAIRAYVETVRPPRLRWRLCVARPGRGRDPGHAGRSFDRGGTSANADRIPATARRLHGLFQTARSNTVAL